jgi:formylglycine-generating enzyme required for sulfatase activity
MSWKTTLRNPAENVTWDEAAEACRRWGGVLPTEAQWEYTCRAGTGSPWGSGWEEEDLAGQANVCDVAYSRWSEPRFDLSAMWDDEHAVHAPVGSYAPNPFGLHDMHGNVGEWCRDGQYGYGDWVPRAGDGLRGPEAGGMTRVTRGGSYATPATFGRSSFRSALGVRERSADIGFRVVMRARPDSRRER